MPNGRVQSSKAILALLAAMATVAGGHGAQAAEQSGTGQVEVLEPAVLTNIANLDFGTIVRSGSGGAITVNAASNQVATFGELTSVRDPAHRAVFTANAPMGALMVLTLDPTVTMQRSGGTETLTANLTHSIGDGLLAARVFNLLVGVRTVKREQTIYVGGTLMIPGNQAEGEYSGEFRLTMNYV